MCGGGSSNLQDNALRSWPGYKLCHNTRPHRAAPRGTARRGHVNTHASTRNLSHTGTNADSATGLPLGHTLLVQLRNGGPDSERASVRALACERTSERTDALTEGSVHVGRKSVVRV